MNLAYRATVTGEPARDFPSAKEALEYAEGSGETECPFADEQFAFEAGDCSRNVHGHCLMCDADRGEKHGYIYLGDGWAEVVYVDTYQEPEDEDF